MAKSYQIVEKEQENLRLKSQIDAIINDSIGYSAIRFINQKGLSNEWARFLLDEAFARAENKVIAPPKNKGGE